MTTAVLDEQSVLAAAPREWWQVWAERRALWWEARPVLTARWARVRAVGLWAGMLWLLGLLVLWPEAGLGLRAYLGALWVAVAWFFLARTKTLTWAGYMRFFSGCVAWSTVIGVVSTFLATVGADTWVRSTGPSVAIAAMTEEALKLVPVALVAVLAPRRASRFAAIDWLLLGVASGIAFQGVEEMARRWWLYLADTLGALLARPWGGRVEVPDGWYRFGAFPVPSRPPDGIADFAGHMVATATTAGLVGVAVTVVGAARASRTRRSWALTVLTAGLPVLALLVSISDHALSNLEGDGTQQVNDTGVPRWLDPSDSTIPAWMRVPWSALGHGHHRVPVLLLLALVLLLVDGHRLARVPASALVPVAAPAWVTVTGPLLARRLAAWPLWLVRPLAVTVQAAVEALWVMGRDLGQCLSGFARHDGDSRRAAVARGQAAVAATRAARELAIEHLHGELDVRRRRLVAVTALLVLLWVALVVAPRVAQQIGSRPYGRATWLAGQLEALSSWWGALSPWQQVAIGAGVAAAVALSGGSLGLALGVSGILTWGLDKSAGIATFVRDPHQATRDYVLTATPTQVVSDTVGVALTFGPGALGGAVVGRGVRTVAEEVIVDPAAWAASRRAAMDALPPDAGVIDTAWLLGRRPVPLADGSVQAALSAADEAAAAARYGRLDPVPTKGRPGPAQDGQVAVYGHNERRIPIGDGKEVHADGFTSTYGALGEYKHVTAEAQTWYDPATLDPRLREVAVAKLDRQLLRMQVAADELADGSGVIEVTTNNSSVAEFVESRMAVHGLRGYVRVVDGGA